MPIYGSSRLGEYKPLSPGEGAGGEAEGSHTFGLRRYELTNHLGNVLTVISDRVGMKQDSVWATVLSASDYYPFGLEMKGRTWTDSTYRYGFNGKENDDETGYTDYGFRLLDRVTGRFITVDPLTNKYPELTPYQFASNTPIRAIDLDGLEAFIIHGTKQTKEGVDFSSETMNQFARISGHSLEHFDKSFRWNAPQLNKQSGRRIESAKLVEHIIKVRREMLLTKSITEDEPITLIGYSHGGNVSLQAIKILNRKYGVKVNLITLSTPAYNRGSADNPRGDPENPRGNSGIYQHIQVVHENDNVVDLAGGTETYTNPGTTNYIIKERDIKLEGGVESHTEVYKSPAYSKFLERIKPLLKAPVPKGINTEIKNENK